MRLSVCTLVAALFFASPSPAGLITKAEISLGGPSVSGTTIDYVVTIDFRTDPVDPPDYQFVYFALDVSASSAALKANDYDAFSFILNPMLNWFEIKNFGNVDNPSRADFDNLDLTPPFPEYPLADGVYTLGTLRVDLSAVGLTPDPSLTVSLDFTTNSQFGEGTQIGVDAGSGTFELLSVTFNPASQPAGIADSTNVVPEPASLGLLVLGGAIAWQARRRSMRRAASPNEPDR